MPQSDLNTRWLPSLGLVAILHVAVWWGVSHIAHVAARPQPLPVVNAELLPPPPPPPPKVEPVRPPPQPEPPRKQPVKNALEPPPPQPILSSQAENAPVMPAPPVEEARPAPVAPTPPPAPAVAPRPAPEPVLELPRFQAAYLSNPPPAYPLAARRRAIEGTSLIRAEVSTEGTCLRAEIRKSSGSELLDQAALEAVKKWRFVPAKRGAVAVVAWVEVPLTFKLEN